MENKLESVWSTEIDEYFKERYGINIGEMICDEILKAILRKYEEITEMNISRRIRILRRQNRRFWKAIARKNRRIAKLKRQLRKLNILEQQINEMKEMKEMKKN